MKGRLFRHPRSGMLVVCAVGLLLVASPPTSRPESSGNQIPALQSDAAWMELERRSEKASLLAALDAARYDARVLEAASNTVAVDNPAQSIRVTFASGEVRLRAGASAMRLRAIGVGYGATLQPTTHVVTRTAGARVEIDRAADVTEWWVNRAAGLEQGYTVREAPEGWTDGAWLRVVMAVDGDLTPRVSDDGQSSTFIGSDGTTRLRYDHVLAVDATGRHLPTRMRTDGTMLSLETNDARAVYPVTIDPTFTAPAYLKASNTGEYDYFGYSVAMSGDTVVVGARFESGSGTGVDPASNESATNAGAAYVFVRSGTTWSQQAYLKASNTGASDNFGYSVAVSGDTVVVGAVLEDGSGTGVNPASNDLAYDAGAAYVFVRSGTTWSPQAYLKASNTEAFDRFGWSVAVSGDTVVVGAQGEDGSGTGVNPASNNSAIDAGAAYVFVRSGTTWNQQVYLKASNTDADDQFGSSVAASGDTIVVGAVLEDSSGTGVNPTPDESVTDSGAVYVFERSGTTWSPPAFLKASNTGENDYFGSSVALSGDTIVVGAFYEDGSGTGVNPASNDGASDAGAAYVFVRSGTTWSPQAYLKSSNTEEYDYFGSVAVSGDTVVVGAFYEDGSGTGVNPASNESAIDAGAAYVFVRSGTTWSLRAYLKASNTGQSDLFGIPVAVSGDTVVVGAPLEDGGGSGVNPASDESAADAGAVYVFEIARPSLVYLDSGANGDAFLYDAATGHWSRKLSQPDGSFVEQSQGSWSPGWSVLPAHFNGDGLTDFFLYNTTSGQWFKMLTDGTGFTTQATGFWWLGWERYVMDLNGDGLSDFFLYDPATGVWFKCVSTSTGFTYIQGGWNPGWEVYPMRLNGGAVGDLFLINRATGRWFWVLGEAGGGFTYPVTDAWFPGWQLYPGDFNGDGLTDLLLHDPSTGIYFVAQAGESGFTYQQGSWSLGWQPHVADFDADGRDDLFLHDPATGMWFQMISDGAGHFTNVGGQTWSLGWSLLPTDLNGDGRTDLVLYDPATGAWYQARNLINGTFSYSSGNWVSWLTVITRAQVR